MTIRQPALLIAYGPEVRAFLHSGLHEGLIKAGMGPVIFASQPSSRVLAGWSKEAPRPFPPGREPRLLQQLRLLSRRTEGRGAAGLGERLGAAVLGGTATWRQALAAAGADSLICASYNSVRTLPALQTAVNRGLPTIVFENSWKDSHRRAYAPAVPSAAGFTTGAALDAYADSNGRSAHLAVCGSLHLSALDRAGRLERSEFCRRLGLDPARPIVCYSTARSGLVPEEIGWVRRLAYQLQRRDGIRPQLLVRTNPMDEVDVFAGVTDLADVKLLKPKWEWNPASDWCCPLWEDSLLWASAIRHSALNVSVASTVTLEFAAFGRPVINPVFESKGRELFDSAVYAEARNNGWAEPASTFAELEALVFCRLNETPRPIRSAPRLDATTRALELVRRVGAAGEPLKAASRLSSIRT